MTQETPGQQRARHRAERREVLAEPAEDRRDRARRLLEEQRREARGGRSGRAPAMSVDERRAAILAVAVPMLVERQGKVTTSEIAAAAGIAEGTLFRAFRDKQALFMACLREMLESETEVGRIEAIDRTLPLADRLTAGVRAVSDYQNRLWSVMVALRSAGIDPRGEDLRPEHRDHEHDHGAPRAMVRISGAIAGLFDPDTMRVAPELAARLLLGFVFSNRLQAEGLGDGVADLDELVDLFLHGILRTATSEGDTP